MATGKTKTVISKPPKKKVWGSKQVLASPFAPTFPSPDPSTRSAVLEILLELFPVPFAQRAPRPLRSDMKERYGEDAKDISESQSTPTARPQVDVQKKSCKKPPGLLCGLNEVTRALEKSLVDIAIVSRDVVPSIMISHIPVLCYLNSARLVVMPGNGAEIGNIFGTRRVLAFAVTREAASDTSNEKTLAKQLAKRLAPLASQLDYPWLAAAKEGPVPEFPKPVLIPHRTKKDIG